MIEVSEIADGLTRDPRGFWVASPDAPVSYPDGYHDFHFDLEDASFWFRHRNRVIVEAVRGFPPAGPIADIGGGNGYVARGLERAGFPTVVIEPGLAGVLNARRRGLPNVICSTVEEAGLRDGALGGVGMFDVLEHIGDDVGFLAALQPKLAQGGRVYVAVPAFRALWSAEDTRSGHFRRYTVASLAATFTAAGYEVEYGTYFFWCLPAPVAVLRTIPTLLGLRRAYSPQTVRREYWPHEGTLSCALERLLAAELRRVRQKKAVPIGSSCLVVARRRKS
jgi:hypothetical protein